MVPTIQPVSVSYKTSVSFEGSGTVASSVDASEEVNDFAATELATMTGVETEDTDAVASA